MLMSSTLFASMLFSILMKNISVCFNRISDKNCPQSLTVNQGCHFFMELLVAIHDGCCTTLNNKHTMPALLSLNVKIQKAHAVQTSSADFKRKCLFSQIKCFFGRSVMLSFLTLSIRFSAGEKQCNVIVPNRVMLIYTSWGHDPLDKIFKSKFEWLSHSGAWDIGF